MKKLLLILLLTVASIYNSYSQISFGIKSGINRSVIRFNDPNNSVRRTGFYGGGLVQADLTKKRFVRAEMLYSIKGSKFPVTIGHTSGKSNLNYINIFLFQGYRPFKKIAFLIGPEMGYLTRGYSRYDGKKVDIKGYYNKFDLAADIGVEYQIAPFLSVDARYSYGFKLMDIVYQYDINGNRVGDKIYDGANRVLQLGMSYHFVK